MQEKEGKLIEKKKKRETEREKLEWPTVIACEMLERAESGKWENDFLQSDTKTRTRMCVCGVCGVCVCVCVCVNRTVVSDSLQPHRL